ncbi:uterine plasmin/trypsin inhibitor isoform X1 [Sus scrofa]|uniref:uterine plasmin/trypsin inhibitor isoform X1 n=1 Tax=Sus scrofa TaxID=9823 RepID=UPI000A2B7789|nr:uterine plasmin/trypsin inhibitor isoform X1 [Sus scrofa]XP_020933622.1 uterine plasmin/trypsin inhibitor isoform X1 [Sus scrofa]
MRAPPRGQQMNEEMCQCWKEPRCYQGRTLKPEETATQNWSISAGPPAFCREPPYTGPCRAHFIRYFYNATTGLCQTFVYGGCRGKQNNFMDEKECLHTCDSCAKAQGKRGNCAS